MKFNNDNINFRLRLDGIIRNAAGVENVNNIPYRAGGNQFYKYKLIVDYFNFGDSLQFPFDALTSEEICMLHYMLSSTLDSWERGDESRTCQDTNVIKRDLTFVQSRQISRCPIERGVIQTRWGTIAPGHIIAGLSAVSQETNVTFQQLVKELKGNINITTKYSSKSQEQTINNVLVSTVIGDLAEVLLNQLSEFPIIGKVGWWNNSLLPRDHYVDDVVWDITMAELLGGIDGKLNFVVGIIYYNVTCKNI